MSDLPPAPAAVARIIHDEAARIRVDPRTFWISKPMPIAVVRARHRVWFRISTEARWSASRIGRLFGVTHRAVLYGIEQAEARRAPADVATPRAAA